MDENTNGNENIQYWYEYYNMLYPKKFKEKEKIRLPYIRTLQATVKQRS